MEGFAGEEIKGRSVVFIPTASIPESYKDYVDDAREAFDRLGVIVDELDVSTATANEISDKLMRNDYIYVSGGNTFFLLQELRKSGADKVIEEQVAAGKLYIGESAGSIIVSPDIEYAKDMDDCAAAPGLVDFSALNLVNFYPVPHRGNFPFEEAVEKIIDVYSGRMELMPISNSEVIMVDGNKIEVGSAG